jgi:hypothetical protein
MATVVVNSTENTVTVVNAQKNIVVADSVARGATGVQGAIGAQGVQGETGVQGPVGNKGLFWERNWNENANYSITQAVFYEGSTYICIANNANVIPVGNTTTWDLLASKGNTGIQGVQGATGATLTIPGPYSDDSAANTAGVSLGNPYYKPDGSVFIRLI